MSVVINVIRDNLGWIVLAPVIVMIFTVAWDSRNDIEGDDA